VKKIILWYLLVLTLLIANSQDKDELKKFEELSKSKDVGDRVEAINKLKKYENLESTKCIAKLLSDEHPRVRFRAIRALARLKDKESIKYLVDVVLVSPNEYARSAVAEISSDIKTNLPKIRYPARDSVVDIINRDVGPALLNALKDASPQVRTEVAYSLGEIKPDNAFEKLEELYKTDKVIDVRAAALESLIKIDAQRATDAVKKGLQNSAYQVRLVATEGIKNLTQEEITNLLEKTTKDKDWRVRATAIKECRHIRNSSCISLLINRLEFEKGRLLEDIADALKDLTGRDLGTDFRGWQSWWNKNKENFQVRLPNEKISEEGARRTQVETKFFNVPVFSNRIVFVLDLSGSMREKKRIEIAKEEMIKTINSFKQDVFFNIVLLGSDKYGNYNRANKVWQKSMVPATDRNKKDAAGFISSQKPYGWTNIYDAIICAFEDDDVDTIFLLSDGGASRGIFISTDEILHHIKKLNKFRKVRINTIETSARTEDDRRLMKGLAEITDGVYTSKSK
jgi:HEAT repeat protein